MREVGLVSLGWVDKLWAIRGTHQSGETLLRHPDELWRKLLKLVNTLTGKKFANQAKRRCIYPVAQRSELGPTEPLTGALNNLFYYTCNQTLDTTKPTGFT